MRVAQLVGRVQVGAVVEGPVIFWTLLLAWPARPRRRMAALLLGVPVFVVLETSTTVCQLISGFAEASAIMAGDPDPVTPWDHWSRFIESGGRDVLAVVGALLTLSGAGVLTPTAGARSEQSTTTAMHTSTAARAHR